jgi:hypothetical protein
MAEPLGQHLETETVTLAPAATPTSRARGAYRLLYVAFVLAPIIAGADKFLHLLVNWDQYLAPAVPELFRVTGGGFMLGVGVGEILAGLIVAARPSVGGWLVALWLWGIIVNLMLIPGYYDIALRDFGLMLGAITLNRLATAFGMTTIREETTHLRRAA